MANEEHLAILAQGVNTWNQWRTDNQDIRPALRAADLRGVDLRGADLSNADLSQADLSNAHLNQADIFQADLRYADLSEADLTSAILSNGNLGWARLSYANLTEAHLNRTNLKQTYFNGANLTNAQLRQADLSFALLTQAQLVGAQLDMAQFNAADLNGADLTNARIGLTVFGNVDLSNAKGLETIIHLNPSYIDIQTLYRSKGSISQKFLLSAGLPKEAIAYLLSLAGNAIYYASCFISYSPKDEVLARRLYNDLQAQGVPVFFAPEDLKIGSEIRQAIDQAIHVHEKLLLILSKNSVESSWVQREVETALEKEALLKKHHGEKSLVLFPIRIDTAVTKSHYAWVADIRRMREIGDFTHWKDPDSYQKAFARLLHDLQTAQTDKEGTP